MARTVMKGFLVSYHKPTGKVNVEVFPSPMDATRERLLRDRAQSSPDVEIVSVASRSENHLRQSHWRYFRRALNRDAADS